MRLLGLLVAFLLSLLSMVWCETTVAIIGTNDIHGKAFPTMLSRPDTEQRYNYGGLVYMARLIQIIQAEHQNYTLFLDAGDQFQGGIEASKLISSGQIITEFFNLLGLQGSSLGNHEFDFGPTFLFPYLGKKDAPSLAANLRSEDGEADFLENQKSSKLFSFPNGIKIGVVGLSTLETPSTTAGFSDNKFPSYQFLDYKGIVIEESRKLKEQGANAVLIVSHVGDECPINLTYGNWTKQTPQDSCVEDEITLLVKSLPEGTIDGVVQGHRHRIAHHFINGIPYMGTINGGYYFNALYLKFNDDGKVIDSSIEGPIPVCEKVFENTGRCNYIKGEELKSAGNLINWKFHGQPVYAHPQLNALFNEKWKPKMQVYLQELVECNVELTKVEDKESPVANLFTSLMHDAVPTADFVIMNPGGFRDVWLPGVIQYQHYYNMFPFENYIETFEITGAELLETLKVLQSGQKGFYQCWNIRMQVSFNEGKKGFIQATFMDGTPIDPTATYVGATIDFLLQGGDDFGKVIKDKVYTPRNVARIGEFKEILKPYLVDLKSIDDNLVDPLNPRIVVNPQLAILH